MAAARARLERSTRLAALLASDRACERNPHVLVFWPSTHGVVHGTWYRGRVIHNARRQADRSEESDEESDESDEESDESDEESDEEVEEPSEVRLVLYENGTYRAENFAAVLWIFASDGPRSGTIEERCAKAEAAGPCLPSRRRALLDLQSARYVQHRVWVWWPTCSRWFGARLLGDRSAGTRGKSLLLYNDGDVVSTDLRRERMQFVRYVHSALPETDVRIRVVVQGRRTWREGFVCLVQDDGERLIEFDDGSTANVDLLTATWYYATPPPLVPVPVAVTAAASAAAGEASSTKERTFNASDALDSSPDSSEPSESSDEESADEYIERQTSRFPSGVFWDASVQKWEARAAQRRRRVRSDASRFFSLGTFVGEVDAARACDAHLLDEVAAGAATLSTVTLNFPDAPAAAEARRSAAVAAAGMECYDGSTSACEHDNVQTLHVYWRTHFACGCCDAVFEDASCYECLYCCDFSLCPDCRVKLERFARLPREGASLSSFSSTRSCAGGGGEAEQPRVGVCDLVDGSTNQGRRQIFNKARWNEHKSRTRSNASANFSDKRKNSVDESSNDESSDDESSDESSSDDESSDDETSDDQVRIVSDRDTRYAGVLGLIAVKPIHPNTWYKIKFPAETGLVTKYFRSTEFVVVSCADGSAVASSDDESSDDDDAIIVDEVCICAADVGGKRHAHGGRWERCEGRTLCLCLERDPQRSACWDCSTWRCKACAHVNRFTTDSCARCEAPEPSQRRPSKRRGGVYSTVEVDETLRSIAAKRKCSAPRLLELNASRYKYLALDSKLRPHTIILTTPPIKRASKPKIKRTVPGAEQPAARAAPIAAAATVSSRAAKKTNSGARSARPSRSSRAAKRHRHAAKTKSGEHGHLLRTSAGNIGTVRPPAFPLGQRVYGADSANPKAAGVVVKWLWRNSWCVAFGRL